ncbi:hypothetical protein ALQ68_05313, partial [Pseudomonas savastanoi pv. glycinea]
MAMRGHTRTAQEHQVVRGCLADRTHAICRHPGTGTGRWRRSADRSPAPVTGPARAQRPERCRTACGLQKCRATLAAIHKRRFRAAGDRGTEHRYAGCRGHRLFAGRNSPARQSALFTCRQWQPDQADGHVVACARRGPRSCQRMDRALPVESLLRTRARDAGGIALMPLALPLGLMFSLIFGVMICMLPAPFVVAAAIGLAAAATIIRRPVRGLVLFCLIGTFLPYSTIQIGVRTTVSEALIMLTWASYLLHAVFQERNTVPKMLSTEKLLVALMLFSAFPFLVGQLTEV